MNFADAINEKIAGTKKYAEVAVTDVVDDIALKTIMFSQPEFVLPLTFSQLNGKQAFNYDISDDMFVKLSSVSDKIMPVEFLAVMISITDAIIASDDYFMNPNNFVITKNHIYVNMQNYSIRLLYVPAGYADFSEAKTNAEVFRLSKELIKIEPLWHDIVMEMFRVTESTSVFEIGELFKKLYAEKAEVEEQHKLEEAIIDNSDKGLHLSPHIIEKKEIPEIKEELPEIKDEAGKKGAIIASGTQEEEVYNIKENIKEEKETDVLNNVAFKPETNVDDDDDDTEEPANLTGPTDIIDIGLQSDRDDDATYHMDISNIVPQKEEPVETKQENISKADLVARTVNRINDPQNNVYKGNVYERVEESVRDEKKAFWPFGKQKSKDKQQNVYYSGGVKHSSDQNSSGESFGYGGGSNYSYASHKQSNINYSDEDLTMPLVESVVNNMFDDDEVTRPPMGFYDVLSARLDCCTNNSRYQLPRTIRVEMHNGEFIIGRVSKGRSKSDFSFPENTDGVSSVHAKITETDGRFYISDLNSTYGTYVQFQKISPSRPVELRDGNTVSFSAGLDYKFRIESAR